MLVVIIPGAGVVIAGGHLDVAGRHSLADPLSLGVCCSCWSPIIALAVIGC